MGNLTHHHHHHPVDPEKFQAELKDKLNSLGYRYTPQRQQIVGLFLSEEGHLTAKEVTEHVQQQSASIDQATIYRSLEFFYKIGVLSCSQMGGQTVYEIAHSVPHHHLVCTNCDTVMPLDDHHFDDLVAHLWQDHQFRAELTHLTISGLCGHCAN